MLFKKSLITASLITVFSGVLVSTETMAETLTVYTYNAFTAKWGPGPAIKKAFEKECGDCTLKYVSLEGGVLNRLKLEGKRNKADILLGLDKNTMTEAQKTGLIAKHNVDTSHLNIPNGWNNAYFIPFDYGYFSFVNINTRIRFVVVDE